MASVEITVSAGRGDESLALGILEENYLPGDLLALLDKAYTRARDQALAWENPNATQRP